MTPKGKTREMTIKELLLKFAPIYALLMIGTLLAMNYVGMKPTGINTAILTASVFWVCSEFGKKNRRYFSGNEKISVVLGLTAIDLALQLAALSLSPAWGNLGAVIFALVVGGTLHLITIYVTVISARILLVKQRIIGEPVPDQ
jgi:hypothetical protein